MSSTSTDRPRFRSTTIGSIQNLTRVLRESLRLRRLRKQKRRLNEANSERMRGRSKSVGNDFVDDEISEIGISCVVASDIGPIMNPIKAAKKSLNQQRRQSRSVDEVELAHMKKQRESIEDMKKLTVNTKNGKTRRRSRDDHDLPQVKTEKDSSYYVNEQKGFRKRFGKLFGSLRMKQQSHTQLQPETPTPSPASSPSDADHVDRDQSNQSDGQNADNNNDIEKNL